MRVIQLATGISGGAGLAALRLNELLNAGGINSKLFTRDSFRRFGGINNIGSNLLGKIVTFYQKSILTVDYDLVTPVSISQGLVPHILRFKPDLIHIHNWYNQLSIKDILFLGQRVPLVFTLHDERLFTGGCHYTLGCENFILGCRQCPAVKKNYKLISKSQVQLQASIRNIEKFGVISPSQWLINQAIKSDLLVRAKKYAVIPNMILSDFPELPIVRTRSKKDSVKFLFIAADLSAKVKDFRFALLALERFATATRSTVKINLQVVGKNLPQDVNIPDFLSLKWHGVLNQNALSNLMLNSDAILISSKAENSPNIIAESQFRGLVVIARSVGGIPELIIHKKSGFLGGETVESFSRAIEDFFQSDTLDEIRLSAYNFACNRWNKEKLFTEHLHFYTELLGIR